MKFFFKSVNVWQSYKQERYCFVHFLRLLQCVGQALKCTRQSRSCLLLCQILIFFTHRLSKKPFLNWLLTTLPHLKYVATLHFNLSLMACVADINVSQGSVATYARCGGIFDIHWTANLRRNLVVKDFYNRLRIDRIVVMSLWPRFFGPPCTNNFLAIYLHQVTTMNIFSSVDAG